MPDQMDRPRAPHVVVIGGGIAGLSAAHAIRTDAPGAHITLLEAADRLGGKILTVPFAGHDLDVGADAFLARVPEARDLAREVGLGDELVSPAATRAHVWARGRLRPLPAGTVYGVPAGIGPLLRTQVVPMRTALRAYADRLLPGKPLVDDVAIGDYVGRRLGKGVVAGLVDPMVGGIYAGRTESLGLLSAVPQLGEIAREHRSLLRGVRKGRAQTDLASPVFHSVPGGLGRLVDAVVTSLGDTDIRLGVRAAALERLGPAAWRVTLAGGTAIIADAVVLACPAPSAARLLRTVVPKAAAELETVEYASVGVVALAYPRRSLAGPAGSSGFLVPDREQRLVKGCTFSFAKWAHLRGGDALVVRASVGKHGDAEALSLDDDELVARAHAELKEAFTVRADPVDSLVTRWLDALPQYAVGHAARVAAINAALDPHTGLSLAGAAYQGVGIPACIRTGQTAGARVVSHLARRLR